MAAAQKRRPGGRTQRHTQAIFDSTLGLLAANGYAALTFNEIADAAGVSRSTLYRRWPTRAELVLDAIFASLEQRIVPPDTGTFSGDLRATLRQIGEYLDTPLGAAVLVASIEIEISTAAGPPTARWETRLADLDPMFDRAIARGEVPADFDSQASFALASGSIYFRRIFMSQAIDEQWLDRVMAVWERSLS